MIIQSFLYPMDEAVEKTKWKFDKARSTYIGWDSQLT